MPLYFIELDFGKAGAAFAETDRLTNSRKWAIDAIRSGEWPNCEVLRVLEVNEDEGTCRDVTEDMAREVLNALDADYEHVPSFLRDFIDSQLYAGAADAHDARIPVAA
jgi:hypothetical protein